MIFTTRSLATLKINTVESALALTAILMLGLIPRLLRFRKKGVFTWDEAAYYREAIVTFKIFEYAIRNRLEIRRTRGDKKAREELIKKYHNTVPPVMKLVYFKPWHNYLNIIFIKIFGHNDYSASIPSLIMGIFTIPVVYLLGRAIYNPAVGLAAAFLLSAGGMHILHSRSSGPEIRTAFCYACILLLSFAHKYFMPGACIEFGYLFSLKSIAILAGIGFFLCGTLCFNPAWLALFPPLYLFSEVFYTVMAKSAGFWEFAITQLMVFSFMFVFYVITDLPFHFLKKFFPESGIKTNFDRLKKTASEMLGFLNIRMKSIEVEYEKPPKWYWLNFYPKVLARTEGIVSLAVLCTGCILMSLDHLYMSRFLAIQGVFMLLFIIFVPYKSARVVLPLIPLGCLYGGFLIARIPLYISVPVILIITIRSALYSTRIVKLTSGIKSAADRIKNDGYACFQCTSAPFLMLYGPKGVLPVIPSSFKAILHNYRSGLRYLFVEHHIKFPGISNDDALEYIVENLEPIYSFDDPAATFYPIKAETEYLMPGDYGMKHPPEKISRWNAFVTKTQPEDEKIRVYDLESFFNNTKLLVSNSTTLYHFANELFISKRYAESLELFQKALKLKESAIYRLHIGTCHLILGRPGLAKKILAKVAEDESQAPEIREMAEGLMEKCI